VEGSGRNLILRYPDIHLEWLSKTTKPLSRSPAFRPRFETGTSRIRSRTFNHSTTMFAIDVQWKSDYAVVYWVTMWMHRVFSNWAVCYTLQHSFTEAIEIPEMDWYKDITYKLVCRFICSSVIIAREREVMKRCSRHSASPHVYLSVADLGLEFRLCGNAIILTPPTKAPQYSWYVIIVKLFPLYFSKFMV
jgi:hypothetical protein